MSSLKYAVVERERRFLLGSLPGEPTESIEISDRYLTGTRLRLREMRWADGTVVHKAGHKVRLSEGPAEIASTSLYLNDEEWAVLLTLPARSLHKTRHVFERDNIILAIDEHADGTLIAEIDDGDATPQPVPPWLDVVEDVSHDERWTGGQLALADQATAESSWPGVQLDGRAVDTRSRPHV